MDDPGPSSQYYASFASTSTGPLRPPSPPSSPPASPSPVEPEDGLYTTLNLPRSASEAEIRDRYRSLAATFHPDRQRDDRARAIAHRQFTDIQRAYEVLTDPTKRTVYDLFGEEGLRTSWEVGPRVKTPQEMRDLFTRQYHEKRAMDAESLIKPKGDMSVVLDARAVFAPKRMFKHPESMSHDILSRAGRLRPGQIMMKHSFEMPLPLPSLPIPFRRRGPEAQRSGRDAGHDREKGKAKASANRTQILWTGQMIARNGAGGGNVVGTVRHQFSPRFWVEAGSSLLGPRVVTSKGTYTIDEFTYVTVNTMQQTMYAPPTFVAQLGRRLYPNTTGFLNFKSGFWTLGPWGQSLPSNPITAALEREKSALSVGLTTARPDGSGWTVETQAGLVANHISADYSWRFWGLKWKLGAAVGSDTGVSGFMDSEGKVGGHSRVGCMVSLAMGGGVTMRWRFTRLGQRVSVPILLSPNLNPYVVLASTVLPFSIYALAYHFVIVPRKRAKVANRIKDLRAEHADRLAQKRQEALEAQDLMSRQVSQRVVAEREKGGLIIISAQYGLASAFTTRGVRTGRSTPASKGRSQTPSDNSANGNEMGYVEKVEDEEEVVVDVTIPVQALVVDSRLHIPGGRAKHNLLGFWDPCIGEAKKIRVRYLFRGKMHEVTLDDTAAIRAPLLSHALDST